MRQAEIAAGFAPVDLDSFQAYILLREGRGQERQSFGKKAVEALSGVVEAQMDKLQFSQALAEIWKVIGECNKYIDLTQPWVLGKDPEKRDRLANVMATLAECVRFVAVLIGPFMPSTPERISGASPAPTQ